MPSPWRGRALRRRGHVPAAPWVSGQTARSGAQGSSPARTGARQLRARRRGRHPAACCAACCARPHQRHRAQLEKLLRRGAARRRARRRQFCVHTAWGQQRSQLLLYAPRLRVRQHQRGMLARRLRLLARLGARLTLDACCHVAVPACRDTCLLHALLSCIRRRLCDRNGGGQPCSPVRGQPAVGDGGGGAAAAVFVVRHCGEVRDPQGPPGPLPRLRRGGVRQPARGAAGDTDAARCVPRIAVPVPGGATAWPAAGRRRADLRTLAPPQATTSATATSRCARTKRRLPRLRRSAPRRPATSRQPPPRRCRPPTAAACTWATWRGRRRKRS